MSEQIYGVKKKVISAIKLRQRLKNFEVSIEKDDTLLIVQDDELVLKPQASLKVNLAKEDDEALFNAISARLKGLVLKKRNEWLREIALLPFSRFVLYKHIEELTVKEAISIFITLTSFAREGFVFFLYFHVLLKKRQNFSIGEVGPE